MTAHSGGTTTLDTGELRAAYERATLGNGWRLVEHDGSIWIDADDYGDLPVAMLMSGSPHNQDGSDAALIVSMHAALPALLDKADRGEALEADNARLREALESIADHARIRIQDGIKMGATVWRLALEDCERDARTALTKDTPHA